MTFRIYSRPPELIPNLRRSPKQYERYFNKCKRCNVVVKGKVTKEGNGKRYWNCPQCLNMQGYP